MKKGLSLFLHTDIGTFKLSYPMGKYKPFIDSMFRTLSENFTSSNVHIGMDEAHMVGLGKYLEQHGSENRFEILKKHLDPLCRDTDKTDADDILINNWNSSFINRTGF